VNNLNVQAPQLLTASRSSTSHDIFLAHALRIRSAVGAWFTQENPRRSEENKALTAEQLARLLCIVARALVLLINVNPFRRSVQFFFGCVLFRVVIRGLPRRRRNSTRNPQAGFQAKRVSLPDRNNSSCAGIGGRPVNLLRNAWANSFINGDLSSARITRHVGTKSDLSEIGFTTICFV
jgi:hypothetical protein